MTKYLNDFVKSGLNNLTDHGSCNLDDTWSACFLHGVIKEPKMDCSDIYSTTCQQPTAAIKDAKVYYAAWNIWSIHSYLKSWADALDEIRTYDFSVFKNFATPAGTDQFLTDNAEVQNIDTGLKNMIHMLNKYQEPADAAILALMKEVPSTQTYNTTGNGLDIGNQMQQRLVYLMNNVSTHEPTFLSLAGYGNFSRQLKYGFATIVHTFLPQDGSVVSITDGEVQEGDHTGDVRVSIDGSQ